MPKKTFKIILLLASSFFFSILNAAENQNQLSENDYEVLIIQNTYFLTDSNPDAVYYQNTHIINSDLSINIELSKDSIYFWIKNQNSKNIITIWK